MSNKGQSPSKAKAALREASITYDEIVDNDAMLGDARDHLYRDLAEISNKVGVFPAGICDEILDATDHKFNMHSLYKNMEDSRSRQQLLNELKEIQTIKQLSRRCGEEIEGKAEWNIAIHSAVLQLALGPDDFTHGS
ncbi:hypothetical protein FSARC_11484 [Fusarium sarcochroum]|uniref:PD-(D/E)XK nuclease-like domain-containing protein n=1 Tax=Fusarium sarcochroum TaxID=1208366 RepID=A0A8H4X0Q8_9HYPO|nr:hypothetical protein FSARC_11484 [Fusarium sarcochroum]